MSPCGGAGCVLRWCVFVVVILERNNAAGLEAATVIGILRTGPQIIKEILDMWDELVDIVSALNTTGGTELSFLRNKERDVMEWIGQVSRQLDSLEQQQAVTLATVHNLQRNLQALPNIIRLGRNLDRLEDLMSRVDAANMELSRYIQRGYSNETEDVKWVVERQTLEDFVSAVVSHSSVSIRSILERIHSVVVPQQRTGLRLQGPGIFKQLADVMHTLGDTLESRQPAGVAKAGAELASLWQWARAEAELKGIEALHSSFRRFQQQQTRGDRLPAPQRAWTDLTATILQDPTSSIPQALSRLNEIIENKKGGEGDLFQQALKESRSNMCNLQQSPQQLLYNLYNSVAITELKGYAMTQFSWMLLRLYNKGNFTLEAELMRERYQERTAEKAAAVKEAMRTAERDMWRCDPREHREGETYVELTQLLQGQIQNEVDMNSESTCRENCAYYSYAKSHGCYHTQVCAKLPRCNGKLIDCRYIDSDMWVCQADRSDRRYSWIEYENGRVLGKKDSCDRGTSKVDSWWRWLFWHCSYCFCLCDEQGPKSDRYFNLREVKADIDNNMVVTGLRFVKENRVIHLQIQQAGLLPRGEINMTSVQWRPVDNYRISDSDVYNGKDYHTLSWEQRAIDLDDLLGPEGSVLTGVRFRRVGTHLNLEIMVTPLNFTAGTLDNPHQKSVWHGNDNTDASLEAPRERLYISSPDVPVSTNEGSIVDSRSDQFLLFTHSDINADAAQTTIPFLDAQPVAPDPPTLLAGAGIYHKGRPGYGGFIGPKVVTYDFNTHIQAIFPVTEDEVN